VFQRGEGVKGEKKRYIGLHFAESREAPLYERKLGEKGGIEEPPRDKNRPMLGGPDYLTKKRGTRRPMVSRGVNPLGRKKKERKWVHGRGG